MVRKLITLALVAFAVLCLQVPTARAFTSVSNCANNPTCASTMVQQGLLTTSTGTAGTGTAFTVQTTVGIGLTSAAVTYAGWQAYESYARTRAAEDNRDLTKTACVTGATLIGSTVNHVANPDYYGIPPTIALNAIGRLRWGYYRPNGSFVSLGDPSGTTPEWSCEQTATEDDPDKLREALEDYLPDFDLSPYTDVAPLPDPPPTPVIDADSGELVQPEDVPLPGEQENPDPLPEDNDQTDSDGDGVPDRLEIDIQPTTFTATHFLVHARQVFSQKFPMDMLGDLPSSGNATCPSLTLFGYTYELCIVVDFLSVLKYPAIIGVAIWALLSL